MSSPVSPDLVSRCCAGDTSALGELLRKLGPGMMRSANRVTGSREDAEDATQEAMLVLARSLGQLKDARAIVPWATRIVLRIALRARGRRRESERDTEAVAGDTTSSDELIERRMKVDRALALLEQLPEEQAEVMLLHYVQGYTIAEVAEAMEVSFHTVTSRVRLAKQHLERLKLRTPSSRSRVEAWKTIEEGSRP